MKSVENNFDHPEVNNLLKKHFIELRSVSPEGSTHVLDIPGLKIPSIKFWSLWENEQIIGCGALKFLDENYGEFKSIRIADKFKKKGLGTKIINHLIKEAKKLNVKKISVETGSGDFFYLQENYLKNVVSNLVNHLLITKKIQIHVIFL